MPSSEEYRRQIMNDLAQGDVESLDDPEANLARKYSTFDDFAERSSRDERRQLFGRSFHPDRVPSTQMEPELQKAISQIKPNERDDVAREFLKKLQERGLSDRDLEQRLSLSTRNPKRMKSEDVSKLAAFAYHNHPDIFQDVLADQPAIVKFLSHPLVGAALGAIASRWLGNRR